MANFFHWIYKFIAANKIVSAVALVIIIGLSVFSALQLKFEEDIVAIMPKDTDIEKTAIAFEGFSMNKRLVFHLYTQEDNHADQLIAKSQELATFLDENGGAYIDDIKLEIPDDQILNLYEYYYNNLPFYLQSQDYDSLASRVSKESVDKAVKQLYKSLMSPMGVVTKTMRVKDPFGFTSFPLERTKELQLDENFSLYKNQILTQDKKHLVFFVVLKYPPNESAENGKLMEIINQGINELAEDNISIEYFGAAAVAVANASRIKTDIYFTVSLALAGLFLFISLFYKRITTFFIVVTPGVFGGLVAIALLNIIRTQVSVISLAVGSILLGITIDYALHFFTHAKKERNIKQLYFDLTNPLLMSSLTTACAFFALLFIRSTALQDLGLFAGISVISAALYTLIVLPHFIKKSEPIKSTAKSNLIEKFVERMASYPFYKKKWALLSILTVSVISFFTWNNVSFESDMLGLNYMPKHLEKNEKNINSISNYSANNIYLTSTGNDVWEAIEKNQKIENLLKQYEADSVIYDHVTLNKIVPTLQLQNERLANWQSFWKQKDAEEVMSDLQKSAAKLGFNANTFADFEALVSREFDKISTEDLNDLMAVLGEDLIIYNADRTVSLLTVIKLSTENKSKVLDEIAEYDDITILDRGYLTSRLVTLLKEDFNKLVNLSLIVVFVILLICYGRIELAIITFVPILLSWLWVLGLMGLFGLKFNIVNIIICTFIFGLGIDYSIFVMRGLTQKYKYGADNLTSYKKSIILSVVTTLLGIGVLAFAQHPALKSIALLAIIGIASVIAITFTVEQILYNFFIGNRKDKGVVPYTLASFFISVFAFLYFLFGCTILQIVRPFFLLPIGSTESKKGAYHFLMRIFTGSLVYIMFNFKKIIVDRKNMDYNKPSVIIANHHSFVDILIVLMFSRKVVMVTNDWVYNSPFFGKPVQYADFIQASAGVETQLDKVQKLVKKGYSIIVFPEGTRNRTVKLSRFHKGAFYLAEQFKLDIQPIVFHGVGKVMTSGDDFYLKNNDTHIKFLPRIKHDDMSFGEGYGARTKKISKYFKSEYNKQRILIETPTYFKETLIKNYLFKGPILEWYLRIKLKMENYYELFHELVPLEAKITDLGCGYGMMTYALAFSSEKREIQGYDYDDEKIKVAQNCPVRPSNISFLQADVTNMVFEKSDAFLISDVLHYFTVVEQQEVMSKMAEQLNHNGMIIIRDGDSEKSDRHKGTKLTEFFSTNMGFNKSRNKLNYISKAFIDNFAATHNFDVEIIDKTKRTSNTVFVLRRNK